MLKKAVAIIHACTFLLAIGPSFSSDYPPKEELKRNKAALAQIRPIQALPMRMDPLTFESSTLNEESSFKILFRDLRLRLFSYLKPEDILTLRKVCRLFYSEISYARKLAENKWDNNERSRASLQWQLTDPRRAVELHQEIAEETPLRVINYDPNAPEPEPVPVRKVVQDYMDEVSSSSFLRQLIRRVMMAADPGRDFRQVCLTALIVEQDPCFQGELEKVLAMQRGYYPSKIQHYVYISYNETELAYYKARYMSCKLLALQRKPHKDILSLMEKFRESLRLMPEDYYSYKESLDKLLPLASVPIWLCYTDDLHLLHSDYYLMLGYRSHEPQVLFSTETLGNYITALFINANTFIPQRLFLLAGAYYESKMDLKNARRCWFESQSCITEPTLWALGTWHSQLATPLYQVLRQNKNETVMEEYERLVGHFQKYLEGNPSDNRDRIFALFKLAEIILIYGDESRYELVKTYLDESQDLFPPNQGDFFYRPTGSPMEFETRIYRGNIIRLLAALAMGQRKFQEAITIMNRLKKVFLSDLTPIHVLPAMREMNHPDFPKELVEHIGKLIRKTTVGLAGANVLIKSMGGEIIGREQHLQIAMLLDEAFIKKFLKGHPIVAAYWKGKVRECQRTDYFGLLPEGEKK